MRINKVQQASDFCHAEQGRGASAEIHGVDGMVGNIVFSLHNLLFQRFQKPVFQFQGRQRIEPAIAAFRFAEGDMDIKACHRIKFVETRLIASLLIIFR